jgi:multicomponent Na+:H+ antiporter subunit D
MGGITSNHPFLGAFGAGILLISALLTGGYLITIFANAFFPGAGFDYKNLKSSEPNKYMTVPLVILSVCCVLFGMFPGPLVDFITKIAAPLF